MKNIFYCLMLFMLASCEKEVDIDKKSILSARINNFYLSVNDAKAVLAHSNYFSGKGQLTLTGEDDKNRIDIIIKDYTGAEGIIPLDNDKAIAVYTAKSSGISDTAQSGRIIIEQVISNFYIIPDLPSSNFNDGRIYKSETTIGTFEFVTRNQVSVTAGIFGISFNR